MHPKQMTSVIIVTHGYAAPDYIETGHLTAKSDVWSFGVVLYEILTGRRLLERNRPRNDQKLLEWVKHYPADSKKFGIIMDSRLENQYSLTAARKIAKLADICLLKSAKERPMMSQVVDTLKQVIEVSSDGSPSNKNFKYVDDDSVDLVKTCKEMGSSESAKRRIAQLARLSEHVGGASKRGFMIMQRAKVP